MKKSAYFPASTENSVSKDAASAANNQYRMDHIGLVPVVHNGGISFPYSSSVLWNRDPISFPKQLRSLDAISPLLLTTADISLVLQRLQSSLSNISKDLMVSPTHYHLLTEDTKDMIGCPVLGIPRYLFGSEGNPRDQLTIPVLKQTAANVLLFDERSTLNLIQNLGKSIRSGREFSMKSCMRIRATGHASNTSSAGRTADCNTLSGTVRMKAILPNISFQAVQLNSIPILATPLAKHLVSTTSHSAGDAPKMGYLTLNQVRKLVTLQETDTSVPLVPLVGVWVKFGIQYADAEIAATLLEHPFVWGACVRFLCSDHIQERVHVAQDTFLLTLIVGDTVEYYEISKLPGGADTNSAVCLSKESDFLCTDFTADLSVSLSTDGSPVQREGEAVICRFRPQVRAAHMQSFQHTRLAHSGSSSSGAAGSALPQQAMSSVPPVPSALSQGRSSAQLFPSALEGSSIESGSLLNPRPSCPQPMKPPESPAKQVQSAQSVEVDSLWSADASGGSPQQRFAELFRSQQGQDVLRLSGALSPADAPSSASMAAVDLVRAQQRQIEELRGQVDELRQMVLQLGGRLPADHFLRTSSNGEPRAVYSAHTLDRQYGQQRGSDSENAEQNRVSSSSGAAWALEAGRGEQAEPRPDSTRLIQLSAPEAPAGAGAGAGTTDDASEHYTEEEFEMDEIDEIDEISDEQDSPNSAESDCEERDEHGDNQQDSAGASTYSHHTGKLTLSSNHPGSGTDVNPKSTKSLEYRDHHSPAVSVMSQQAPSAKSGNTATAKHSLGIGASEMDSIYVGARYSGTTGHASGLPRSASGKWVGSSSGVSAASRAASRINQLLDHEEEHPTLMESESILQIQARYC